VRLTRRRCQRRTVPGEISRCLRSLVGRSRISAARTARPPSRAGAGDWRGAARRPRAAARAARRPWRSMAGWAGPASRRAGQRRGRATAGPRMIMMPYGWGRALPQLTGYAYFWHPTGPWAAAGPARSRAPGQPGTASALEPGVGVRRPGGAG